MNVGTGKKKEEGISSGVGSGVSSGQKTGADSGGIGTKEYAKAAAQKVADSNYSDFTKGTDYQSLAKRYRQSGQTAMQDTLGQMAARTGGMASSYAGSAAQQVYNSHMSGLEDAARALYDSERQELMDKYNLANSMYTQGRDEQRYADETAYSRELDRIANEQWQQQFDESRRQYDEQFAYGKERDQISDQQWQQSFDYGRQRDQIEDQRYDDQTATADISDAESLAQEEIMTRIMAGESVDDLGGLIASSGKSAEYWNAYAAVLEEERTQESRATADTETSEIEAAAQEEVMMRLMAGENPEDLGGLIASTGKSMEYWNAYATVLRAESEEAAETAEFYGVDYETAKGYSDYMSAAGSKAEAEAIAREIAAATGNQDFADAVLASWAQRYFDPLAQGIVPPLTDY